MNNIKLVFDFFYKNIARTIALLLILISTGLILTLLLGKLFYYDTAIGYFKQFGANADIIGFFRGYHRSIQSDDVDEINRMYREFLDTEPYAQVEKLNGVKKLYSYYYTTGLSYYDTNASVILADDEICQKFHYPLSSGNWFDTSRDDETCPEAVVCGAGFENVRAGDIIKLTGPINSIEMDIKIVGKVAPPYFHVNITTDIDRCMTMENVIFFRDSEITRGFFSPIIERGGEIYQMGAIVQYDDNASADDITACRSFFDEITNHGIIATYNEKDYSGSIPVELCIEKAESMKDEFMKSNGIRNIFFSVVAILMSVILSMLMNNRRMNDYYVWFLTGCSKIKSFAYSFAAIGAVNAVAGIIISVFVMFFSHYIISNAELHDRLYLFDARIYITVWSFLALIAVISAVIPFVTIMRKKYTIKSVANSLTER